MDGAGAAPADPRRIAPGRTAALFLALAFPNADSIPPGLRHRLTFEKNPALVLKRDTTADALGDPQFDAVTVPVRTEKPPILGPPLPGGPWKLVGGIPGEPARLSFVIREGRARVPLRFGCDFTLTGAKGELLPAGAPSDLTNAMFYGYGADVLAVEEGVVTYTRDGIPDNQPVLGEGGKAPVVTRDTVSGNWIALDLGSNRYAFYTHLQPGSLRVKTGDKVRAGQPIAKVGNSGESTIPHLGFHVGDGSTPLGCEGVPFVLGTYEEPPDAKPHAQELPVGPALLRFP